MTGPYKMKVCMKIIMIIIYNYVNFVTLYRRVIVKMLIKMRAERQKSMVTSKLNMNYNNNF